MPDPGWPPAEPDWFESWDHHVHGFVSYGEVTAVALCRHVSSRSSLRTPPEYGRYCGACLLIHEPSRGQGSRR